MSYDSGYNFGSDQIFINPTSQSFAEYNPILMKPTNKKTTSRSTERAIRQYATPASEANLQNQSFNYWQDSISGSNTPGQSEYDQRREFIQYKREQEAEALKKRAIDAEHRNDILLIFIVYLVIICVMNYSSSFNFNPLSYVMPGSHINQHPLQSHYIQQLPSLSQT
jgi:hypothetical protein